MAKPKHASVLGLINDHFEKINYQHFSDAAKLLVEGELNVSEFLEMVIAEAKKNGEEVCEDGNTMEALEDELSQLTP